MKNQFVFWMVIIFFGFNNVNDSFAQAENKDQDRLKWHFKTGFGYYNPMGTGGEGNVFFSELGYTFPTRFMVGIGFGLSDVFETYSREDVPLFEGFRTYDNYYLIRLFIDRSFFAGKKHRISFGTGLLYNQIRFSKPEVFIVPKHNELGEIIGHDLYVDLYKSNSNYIDLGMLLKIDYAYYFKKIGVGFRSELHYLYDTGLGGLIVSPQITVSF